MKKTLALFTCSILLMTSLGIGCEKKDSLSSNNKDKIEKIVLNKEKAQQVNLDLYFDSSKDKSKSSITKEERLIQKDELLAEIILEELIKGPSSKSDLKPILPKETKVLSLSIKDGIAYINLSADAQVSMTPAKEESCLKGIVSSLAQISSINKIKILIDNKDATVLGGNFDISKPFGEDDIDVRKK